MAAPVSTGGTDAFSGEAIMSTLIEGKARRR
jgi:hypothetical protein